MRLEKKRNKPQSELTLPQRRRIAKYKVPEWINKRAYRCQKGIWHKGMVFMYASKCVTVVKIDYCKYIPKSETMGKHPTCENRWYWFANRNGNTYLCFSSIELVNSETKPLRVSIRGFNDWFNRGEIFTEGVDIVG